MNASDFGKRRSNFGLPAPITRKQHFGEGPLGQAGARRGDHNMSWADDGLLRHTVFLGLRENKPAPEVRREAPRGQRD
jgi:hypothetical protein